jgi:hypothetical protein
MMRKFRRRNRSRELWKGYRWKIALEFYRVFDRACIWDDEANYYFDFVTFVSLRQKLSWNRKQEEVL